MNLKKIFKFPSPKKLGISKHNALPMKRITPDCSGISWEDYDKILQMRYPIRYFIFKIFDSIFLWFTTRIIMTISHYIYKIKCYLLKSYKFHILDLRQPYTNTYDDYKYGYQETPEKIKFAVFNLLNEYVKREHYWITEKDIEEDLFSADSLRRQYLLQQEALYLHKWWNVYRKEDLKEFEELTDEWMNIRHSPARNSKTELKLRNDFRRMEQDLENSLDEHLIRVIKIRQGMWT